MHWARDSLINTAKQTVNKAIDYSLNNIGNFTGDYIAQTHINDLRSNLHTLTSIGESAFAGFMFGGPVGAVISTSLAVLNTGTSSLFQIHSNLVANRKTNYEIEQLKNRSGMNTLLDGSRGTEN